MEKKNALIRDLTTGSVPKTLLTFSMPLFLSGLLQMVYNMVDMIVVGQMVGTSGLSAVSVGGEILMLITFIAMGFSNAGQILISRYVGENRHDLIGEMVATLFTLLMSIAVVITVVFLFKGLTGQEKDLLRLKSPAKNIVNKEIMELIGTYYILCLLGHIALIRRQKFRTYGSIQNII